MSSNVYSLSDLKNIINVIKTINVEEDEKFDLLRIVSMKRKKLYEENMNNVLFFPITIDDKCYEEGWVKNTFDLRDAIDEITQKHPEYTYVVEEDMINKITTKNIKMIVVDNIMKSVDDLYDYVIKNNDFKVVAVTGSAGKTTTVGMIEKVLSTEYNVLRIYSDRITPIILKSYIINLLNENIDVVALEMGIFYKHHVEALSDLINPDYAAIINIGDAHLGTGGLNSIDDICKYKSRIFKYAKVGYVNTDNEYLKRLNVKNKKLFYNDEYVCDTNMDELKSISPSSVKYDNNSITINNNKINVPILTVQSIVCDTLAYNIGKDFNISDDKIIKAINEFTVVEHRLQRVNIFGKNVIFDGDSSFKERIHQLSLHLYDKAYLVIRHYAYAEYKDDFIGIKDYFSNFDKVFLFSNIRFIDELKDADNVVVVDNHDFMRDLDGEIFYHCNDYFYLHKENYVDEKYLI